MFKLVASFSETRTPDLERISRVHCASCSHSTYARCIRDLLKGLVRLKVDWRIQSAEQIRVAISSGGRSGHNIFLKGYKADD